MFVFRRHNGKTASLTISLSLSISVSRFCAHLCPKSTSILHRHEVALGKKNKKHRPPFLTALNFKYSCAVRSDLAHPVVVVFHNACFQVWNSRRKVYYRDALRQLGDDAPVLLSLNASCSLNEWGCFADTRCWTHSCFPQSSPLMTPTEFIQVTSESNGDAVVLSSHCCLPFRSHL